MLIQMGKEPPKQRRLRVKNKVRFVVFLLIVLAILVVIIHHIYQPAKEIMLDRWMALKTNLDYWLK
ncbi:hypothetical protein KVG29_04925 [Caldicoprobacter algeriensis]|uniref:hypothetical protein n=1 Tax=Caldicoprobacter algeriensis TaxID=699281 RepID=UPI0020799DFB|nr:hypothetical protein [Caldicoprobacter algeriensis]MCM8900571.1 hypothetical protein [Caldicoprobacter algeriensis]